MLKKRLIPKLQLKMSSISSVPRMVLVTTIQFGDAVEIGDPVSQAKIYEAQAADELILVDIDASSESRGPMLDVLRNVCEEIFMPITVGGGVRTIDDFRSLLNNGADKVSINSEAVNEPQLIYNAAKKFGSQCVVVSIDCKEEQDQEGTFKVWTHGGTCRTELDAIEWAIESERLGAGELLVTSIDRDGTRSGLELDLIRTISDSVSIPVIASGGCGMAKHFVDGYLVSHVSAVSAGTYFCFKDENPMQTRAQIKNAGIPIRLAQ